MLRQLSQLLAFSSVSAWVLAPRVVVHHPRLACIRTSACAEVPAKLPPASYEEAEGRGFELYQAGAICCTHSLLARARGKNAL